MSSLDFHTTRKVSGQTCNLLLISLVLLRWRFISGHHVNWLKTRLTALADNQSEDTPPANVICHNQCNSWVWLCQTSSPTKFAVLVVWSAYPTLVGCLVTAFFFFFDTPSVFLSPGLTENAWQVIRHVSLQRVTYAPWKLLSQRGSFPLTGPCPLCRRLTF